MFFRAPKTQNLVIWQLGPARKTSTNYTDQNPPAPNSINRNNTQTNSLSLSLSLSLQTLEGSFNLAQQETCFKGKTSSEFQEGMTMWSERESCEASEYTSTHLLLQSSKAAAAACCLEKTPHKLQEKTHARTHTHKISSQSDTKTYKISSHRDTHKQTRFLCKKHKIDKTNNQIIQFLGSKISKTIWETYQKQIKGS